MTTTYLFDSFILNAASIDDAKHEIMLAWGDIGGSILYLVSSEKKEVFPKISSFGWLIVALSEYHHMLSPNDGNPFFCLGIHILGLLESIMCLYFRFSSTNVEFNI